jgi:hypothetical protein
MKKQVTLLLSLSLFLTLSSCQKGEVSSSISSSGPEKVEDVYLVQNGLSDYRIVLPSSPLEKESYAAQELTYFLKESSGAKLSTVSESELKSTDKYISLGDTSQFKAAFPDLDLSSLKGTQSAYYIASKDQNIYLCSDSGYSGYGTLYGVYDLLHELISYTYYNDNEIYYDGKKDVNFVSYPGSFVFPSFDCRSISTYYNYTHDTHNTRLRLINNSRGVEWDDQTYGHGAGHGQVDGFVSPEDIDENGVAYKISHPDWFMSLTAENGQNQLCWTAGDSLESLIAEKLIGYIEKNPKARYFMFAQQDNKYVCQCERCKKALEEYGGTSAGLQIDFMNHVIDKVQLWLDSNAPERVINYLIYAYYGTEQAPTKKDEKGALVPYSTRVVPNKNIRIVLAPITINYAFPFASPENRDFYATLQEWKVIASQQILLYLYDLNYTHYFANFNHFGNLTSMFRDSLAAGASYILTQGISDSNATGFDEMRSYIESRLMWDVSLSYDALAQDFMNHYYKNASPYLYEIYQMMRDRYAYVNALDPATGYLTGDVYTTTMFPMAFVERMADQIEAAFASISSLKDTDNALYTTLYNRIMKENLNVLFYELYLYRSDYTDEEVAEKRSLWKLYTAYFGITRDGEGGSIANLFD